MTDFEKELHKLAAEEAAKYRKEKFNYWMENYGEKLIDDWFNRFKLLRMTKFGKDRCFAYAEKEFIKWYKTEVERDFGSFEEKA